MLTTPVFVHVEEHCYVGERSSIGNCRLQTSRSNLHGYVPSVASVVFVDIAVGEKILEGVSASSEVVFPGLAAFAVAFASTYSRRTAE